MSYPGKGVHWVTDVHQERPIRMGTGIAGLQPVTIMQIFKNTCNKYGKKNSLSVKRDGVWKNWTWNQYQVDVMQFARALVHIGYQKAQCISILGFNSPEWFIANLGAIAAGGVSTGIYQTSGVDACKYIIEHSESTVVVVENEHYLKTILQVRAKCPFIKAIVQYSGVVPKMDGVYSWKEFMDLGNKEPVASVEERLAQQKPSDPATLIYTSGTTGPPKAVVVSHDNITWVTEAGKAFVDINENDIFVSYLPLSHIAAQCSDIHTPMQAGAQVFFAQPDALKGTLGDTLKEVRPTVFLGVPRVWEKIQEKIQGVGKANPLVLRKLSAWARGVGLSGGYAEQNGTAKPYGYGIANAVVFSKIKAAMGLDRCRMMGTSAAPISKDTLEYFLSLGCPLYEIYGMSETCGPETANWPGFIRTGSAGRALPGTELKIDKPDEGGNGEICWRGRHVMLGYLKNDQATAEAIDGDGWLHSGDIGKLDKDGYLYITGRIKELIITAGGENVPPILIEDELNKLVNPVVSNSMVIGDRRKFLACLFTLKVKPIENVKEGQYPFSDELQPDTVAFLKSIGSSSTTVAAAKVDPKLRAWLQECINTLNKNATSAAQQVRRFLILDQEFAIENDCLTPTMKLKRRVVIQKYNDIIEKMYADAERELNLTAKL